MTKPRVVMVHPPSKLYPFEFWAPAFDGLDVETVAVECRTRAEALEAVRGADVVMIGFFKVDAEMVAAMDRAQAISGSATATTRSTWTPPRAPASSSRTPRGCVTSRSPTTRRR